MIQLKGAYTALVTPFTENASAIDWERFDANIRRQTDGGVAGVVPCGTTGETPTLTAEEYRAVLDRTIDRARSAGMSVIPGAGSNSTAHAVELHRFAAQAGADAALHVTPYYNKPSQEGLYRHFMEIAEASDLPIVLYNIPGRTAVALTIETIMRLAQHPNIVAVKEATGSIEMAAEIAERTDLVVLSGDDPLTLPMATVGARGVISVLSNVCPDRVSALCEAFLADEWERARSINAQLLPLARGLLKLDTNPVPVKAAMQQLGWDSGAVRLPLCGLADDAKRHLREILDVNQTVNA